MRNKLSLADQKQFPPFLEPESPLPYSQRAGPRLHLGPYVTSSQPKISHLEGKV